MIFVRTLGCLLRVRGKVLFLGSAVLMKVLQVPVCPTNRSAFFATIGWHELR